MKSLNLYLEKAKSKKYLPYLIIALFAGFLLVLYGSIGTYDLYNKLSKKVVDSNNSGRYLGYTQSVLGENIQNLGSLKITTIYDLLLGVGSKVAAIATTNAVAVIPTVPPKPIPTVAPPPIPTIPNPPAIKPHCPETTMKCVPCVKGQLYCRTVAGQTNGFLGWSCQNNNPGNVRYSEQRNTIIVAYGGEAACGERGGFSVFRNYLSGRNSLGAYLKGISNGAHSAYPTCGACTLVEFFRIYAPSSDGNNPDGYANTVGSWIGVDPTTTSLTWVVNNKLQQFIDAIQRKEGWFVLTN